MEKMLQIEQSIATPLECFEFIVQAFDIAAIVSVDEIVDDFHPPMPQGVDEPVEAAQPTSCDASDPDPDFGFGGCWGAVLVKNCGQ